MRRIGVGVVGGWSGLSGCASVRWPADEASTASLRDARAPQIAAFSDAAPNGRVPGGWYPFMMRRDKGRTRYLTVEDAGRTVLQAQAQSSSTALICPVDIDPNIAPWLEWTWKVDALQTRADVADDYRDDSPTRLVIAIDGDERRLNFHDHVFFEQVEFLTGKRLPYATLMYVWDPLLPVGSVVHYPRSSRIRYLVVESGSARLGGWARYRRHLADDYRHVFGEDPGRVLSVAVLTDSDDLKVTTEALYGDVSLSAR